MKTIYGKTETRYILETDASTVSTGNIASVEKPLGELQKRQSVSVPVTQKPRQGPLRPQTGGGAHRDKKKEQKQGKEKHRKPFDESTTDKPDHEISMASSELKSIASDARQLLMLLKKYSEMEGLQAWQQSKITKAADYMTSVLRSINSDQNPLEGRYGRSSWDSSMPSWQDREQRSMDADKRAFKYAELQHELGHEEEPYRPQRRYSSPASSGMYFYNVKPGQENDASRAGLKQTKSGKWYSKNSNQEADKMFGPGRYWEPKSESVAEEKQKGVDGKACWKGYKRMGTKKKGGRTVDNCVKVGEENTYSESLISQLNSLINEKAPPGDKYERMVKHIKAGYSKDGKLTDVEKSKAYGAAWKAKNKAKK